MATPCPASASASKAAIEQPEAELFLELLDLAGQRGLGDAQAQRRLRDMRSLTYSPRQIKNVMSA